MIEDMRVNPQKIIRLYNKGVSVDDISKELCIHVATVYRWLGRARVPHAYTVKYSSRDLKRKSTAPRKKIKSVLKSKDRVAIEDLWLTHKWDVRKIVHVLKLSVSHMTVYRFLKKKGYIKDVKRYRRPFFQETVHMHAKNVESIGYLQMDVKVITPELSGLPWTCFEYAIIDIYSRYKDAVILNQLDQNGSICALLEMFPRLPFDIKFIQTDNGLEFQAKFQKFLEENNIKHHFIHKSTPNENAVIERSFRTDEDEFFHLRKKRPKHYDDLRNQFAQYLVYYNTERPHFGIDLRTPIEVINSFS